MAGIRYASERAVLLFEVCVIEVVGIEIIPLNVATPGFVMIAGIKLAGRN